MTERDASEVHEETLVARLAYGSYALAVALLVAAALWPAVALELGSWRHRFALTRLGAKAIRRLTGVPLVVVGALPKERPLVVVANHESFVDGAVLIAALEEPCHFLVGAVFSGRPLFGRFLAGLGCAFAGAGTPGEASAMVHRLAAQLRSGESVAGFPEGGLGRSEGLRPFHLGAFSAAAEAGAPVVPVAVSGTRAIVPPGRRLPRRSPVEVRIGAPITPTGAGWRAVVALRNEAQEAVAGLLASARAGR